MDYDLSIEQVEALSPDLVSDVRRLGRKAFEFDPKFTWDERKGFILCRAKELGFPRPLTERAMRIDDSQRKRKGRVRSRIEHLATQDIKAWFLTLTFKPSVLETTSIETRRRYVARYLKDIAPEYVANIDFGDERGREHYHAVVIAHAKPQAWQYGFTKAEPIGKAEVDQERLAKYITKLTLHALKVERTGKARRLIYSRKRHILNGQSLLNQHHNQARATKNEG